VHLGGDRYEIAKVLQLHAFRTAGVHHASS
jgi:hypothetical protein